MRKWKKCSHLLSYFLSLSLTLYCYSRSAAFSSFEMSTRICDYLILYLLTLKYLLREALKIVHTHHVSGKLVVYNEKAAHGVNQVLHASFHINALSIFSWNTYSSSNPLCNAHLNWLFIACTHEKVNKIKQKNLVFHSRSLSSSKCMI